MSVLTHTPDFFRSPHTTPKPGPLRRMLGRYVQWRQRRAEEEIALRLGLTDGRMTDEIERRMNERIFGNGGFRS